MNPIRLRSPPAAWRQIFLAVCGVILFTSSRPFQRASAEPRHQISELHQVRNTQQPTPLAEDHLWIGRYKVRPLPRHRVNAVLSTQQEPRAVPVVPLAHTDEPLSTERMERVRHTDKTLIPSGRACILS